MRTETVPLDNVDYDNSPIVRSDIRHDIVAEYAEVYRAGEPMEPPDLFQIPKTPGMLIGDGRHRLMGAREAGLKSIPCKIHEGTVDECILFALASNRDHGVRRTNEDKRVCVETAVKHYPNYSDNRIAAACFVSNHLVAEVRGMMEVAGSVGKAETRVDSAGVSRPAKKRVAKVAAGAETAILENSKIDTLKEVKEALLPAPAAIPAKPLNGTILVDEEGYPLTRVAAKHWQRRDEVQKLLSAVSFLKGQLMKIAEARDALYFGISFNRALDGLSEIYNNISNAKPYALCTECEGHPEIKAGGRCAMCGNKGMISKFAWDTYTPKEKKDLRLAAIQRHKVKK